ncbi:MAG TPA: hypothetical protein VMG38_06445 [Trebonia sp.]|nr:hypothetical protein [Trebonia sp.]
MTTTEPGTRAEAQVTILRPGAGTAGSRVASPGTARRERAGQAWLTRHLGSLLALFGCLVVAGAAMAWNLQGYPGRVNDDEGTYVTRAWAMIYSHHLANYTYFWDHPFLGWATIAGWALLTDGFHRDLRAVMVGRELMWVTTMISCALVYGLSRRLQMNRFFACVAVLAFGLSPVAIFYHRMVSLDNLATMWALAALLLATSARRSLTAAVGSGGCFALATWSKETIALLLPAVLWALGQQLGPQAAGSRPARQIRRKYIRAFLVVYGGIVALYPLLAAVKGELLPGRGHVSLLGEIGYQLVGRQSTGSLLDIHSATFYQARQWVTLDPWLTLGGVLVLAGGLALRRGRPAALALLIQVLYLVKGGYVPYAFVTAMLPFAAITIAGLLDWCWARSAPRSGLGWPRLAVLVAGVACAAVVLPGWGRALVAQSRTSGFAAENAAVAWIARHVPAGQVVACDDYLWPDVKLHTKATPVYLWTVDYDPAVMREVLPGGYRDISYLVLDPASSQTRTALPRRPTLEAALRHSALIEKFGRIEVYKVTATPRPGGAPRR